jgi:hypothetical protein
VEDIAEPGGLLGELLEMNAEADKHFAEFTKLSEGAKSAKKRWEASVGEIQAALRKSQEKHPLFDGAEPPDGTWPRGPSATNGDVIDVDFDVKQIEGPDANFAPEESKQDDSWKTTEVVELRRHGLTDGVIIKLQDAGMGTIGAMANWTSSGKRLTDLPGIGESKSTEIEDALESFWFEWQHTKSGRPENDPVEDGPKTKSHKKSA